MLSSKAELLIPTILVLISDLLIDQRPCSPEMAVLKKLFSELSEAPIDTSFLYMLYLFAEKSIL